MLGKYANEFLILRLFYPAACITLDNLIANDNELRAFSGNSDRVVEIDASNLRRLQSDLSPDL